MPPTRAAVVASLTWTTDALGLNGARPGNIDSLLQTSVSLGVGDLGEGEASLEGVERPDEHGLADWPGRSRHRAWQGAGRGAKGNVVQMLNYGDVQYVTYLSVGGQTITGVIDTGSFELVVFSHQCGSCGQAGRYDPLQSSSYTAGKLMTVQRYGSGDTYSVEAVDSLGLGSFQSKNQTFWEVVSAKMPVLQNAAFHSIVGVGPPETPAADSWDAAEEAFNNITRYYENSAKPPVDLMQRATESIAAAVEVSGTPTMLENFDIQTFSMCLGKTPGSDGYITWQDTAHEVQPHLFTRVQVLGRHTWSVALTNVRLEGGNHRGDTALACSDGCSALMDSGTSLLAVPTSILDKFEHTIQSLQTDCSNLHELPDLVFELGGQKFYLPADAYVGEVIGSVPSYLQSFVRLRNVKVGHNGSSDMAMCHLLLMESFSESAHGPLWILGMPFLRRYYTSFHVGRDHDERALFIAHAGRDCQPVPAEEAERGPWRRRIDPTKLHVPSSVVKASSRGFVNL